MRVHVTPARASVADLSLYRSFAKRSDDASGQYFAEITDQTGKPLDLPESDRRNLITGQALQEHGRKLLARGKEHAEDALLVLQQADKHFSQGGHCGDRVARVLLLLLWSL